jgi:hypothetical protein
MRLTILGCIAAAASSVAIAGAAHAADASPTGLELGLRTGYAIPFGDRVSATPITDTIKGAVPAWFDVGYRFNPNMYVGGYVQYGFGFINNGDKIGCSTSGYSCSLNIVMFGADFHYHLLPYQEWDPWVGVGFGYETFTLSVSSQIGSASSGDNGVQFFNVQAGADYKVMPNLGVGPFVMFGLGQYSNCSSSGPNVPSGCSIPQTALHEWLTLGVRGAYDINFGG